VLDQNPAGWQKLAELAEHPLQFLWKRGTSTAFAENRLASQKLESAERMLSRLRFLESLI